MLFVDFLYVVVSLLAKYALIDVSIFATNSLENGFSAIEHGVEVTFPPILQKLPSLLPQLAIGLCDCLHFEFKRGVEVELVVSALGLLAVIRYCFEIRIGERVLGGFGRYIEHNVNLVIIDHYGYYRIAYQT